jgi:hypothetical protein
MRTLLFVCASSFLLTLAATLRVIFPPEAMFAKASGAGNN